MFSPAPRWQAMAQVLAGHVAGLVANANKRGGSAINSANGAL